eukprot:m.127002 g.127002  ORF g.127002 m.127002 type:complete len:254 (-) comp14536_c0_seq5:58-819(-)
MAARNFTPVNQIRLTNVAIVRMKKGGKRFELACFRNKVMAWRSKTEKDIDEVLQTHSIFTNTSKGQLAKKADLVKAFGTENEEEIVAQILEKGQLQVSKEERDHKNEESFQEVARMVAERCVNPDTQRPYTMTQIERAMKDIHVSIKPNQGLKQQALEVIRQLKESIPVERARMLLRVTIPSTHKPKSLKTTLEGLINIETEEWDDGDLSLTCTIDPGNFRSLDDHVKSGSKGEGTVEILSVTTVNTTDTTLE